MAKQWIIDPEMLQGDLLWRIQWSSKNYSIFDANILYLECKLNVFYNWNIWQFVVAMETIPLSQMEHFGCHLLGIISVTQN